MYNDFPAEPLVETSLPAILRINDELEVHGAEYEELPNKRIKLDKEAEKLDVSIARVDNPVENPFQFFENVVEHQILGFTDCNYQFQQIIEEVDNTLSLALTDTISKTNEAVNEPIDNQM